jgi:hypothetical protein
MKIIVRTVWQIIDRRNGERLTTQAKPSEVIKTHETISANGDSVDTNVPAKQNVARSKN